MKMYTYKGHRNICGKQIKDARIKRGLTQEELAAQLQIREIDIERDSISRIEIGTRFVTDFELKVFSEVLNISVNNLLNIK